MASTESAFSSRRVAGGARQLAPALALVRPVVRDAVAVWLASRLALILLTYAAIAMLGLVHGPTGLGRGLLAAWERWDTNWYLIISRGGYWQLRAANFFPLYPKSLTYVLDILGDANGPRWPHFDAERLGAALLLSNAAALVAFVGIGLLCRREFPRLPARRAIILVAAYPLSFFLAAGYPDSCFLALAVFTLYFARQGQWLACAGCAGLAALTSQLAVALMVPVVYEFVRQQGWWRRPEWRRPTEPDLEKIAEAGLVVGAVPLGFLVYMAYLWRQFDEPLAYFQAEGRFWHRALMFPWQSLLLQVAAIWNGYLRLYGGMALVDLLALALVLGVTVLAWRTQPFSFTAYSLGLVGLVLLTPRLDIIDVYQGASRFMIAAVPVYLAGAKLLAGRPQLQHFVLAAGFLLQAVFCAAFLSGSVPVF